MQIADFKEMEYQGIRSTYSEVDGEIKELEVAIYRDLKRRLFHELDTENNRYRSSPTNFPGPKDPTNWIPLEPEF